MGEDVREIIVMDTWVVIGEGLALVVVSALVEADWVVVTIDVTRAVGSCILAERVSNTAGIRNRGAV
jgi:hypothetical protein